MKIQVNELPKRVNETNAQHWRYRQKEKNKWHKIMILKVGRNKPYEPLESAKINLIRCSSVQPDFDGLVSSFKYVLDGLIKAGVILDDKPKIIGYPTYNWEKAKRGEGHIKIEIIELQDSSAI